MNSKFGLNPWTTIWTQPRKTIRAIVENNPRYHFFYLSTIYASQFLLFFAYLLGLSIRYNAIPIIVVCIIISPLVGAAFLYFNTWILHFTGRWFKGAAPFIHVRAALSWSKVPNIIPLLMWFTIFVFSLGVITKEPDTATIAFMYLIILINIVWSFVILLRALQEVQKFSILRSFSNIIVAYVISSALLYIFRRALAYVLIFLVGSFFC